MKSNTIKIFVHLAFIFLLCSTSFSTTPHRYFKIRVLDEETGRGIPLVELRTQSWIRYYTDSNGLVAFYEPGLMDQDSYLFIESEGYEYPKDLIGFVGFVINPSEKDSIVVKMRRVNIAERLYRITGPGIYRDSFLLGVSSPLKNPLLNGKVLGQDSNLSLIYKGRIFWVWGDTFKPAYPWGNTSVSAATSELPENGGLLPEIGVDLDYFVDSSGFSKPMIDLEGKGFVWFDWLMTIPDASGEEKLVAKYARVRTNFTNFERGIAVYNDQNEKFEKFKQVDAWIDEYHSCHHPLRAQIGDKEYAILTSEFAFTRVEPSLNQVSDPHAYEAYTCLESGATYVKENPKLDRDSDGKLVWDWKANTDVIDLVRQRELVASGAIQEEEKWIYLQDIANGESLPFRRGSIYWNEFRERWILIVQKDMGEIWYAEGDTPTGPWVFAKKVVTHNQFFYNPVHHPFFDQDKGRIIYFEGTYTNMFNVNPVIKPRYEYNQLMYRLALDDPRLFLPVPVYKVKSSGNKFNYELKEKVDSYNNWDNILSAEFLAFPPDRALHTLIPVYQTSDEYGSYLSNEQKGEILFYACPPEEIEYEKIMGIWECKMTDGVFLNLGFKLDIQLRNDTLVPTINEMGYSVMNMRTTNDSLEFTVTYVDNTYHFKGEVNSARIKGSWSSPDSSSTGTWEGENSDHLWQMVHSPLLAPLFVYTDAKTLNRFYSTDRGPVYESYKRSDKALCRIWKNPATNIKIEPAIRTDE